jgi:hypothetical protein
MGLLRNEDPAILPQHLRLSSDDHAIPALFFFAALRLCGRSFFLPRNHSKGRGFS